MLKKGGCRKAFKTPREKNPYCPAHQTYCTHKECDERVHLKTEPCIKCTRRMEGEEKRRKEEEQKKKAKAEADKKKASMAQSEKDRNNKNKRR